MALRDGRGAGLGRVARGGAGVVALYLAAGLVAIGPDIRHARGDFLAWGSPRSASVTPGDHLQAAYNLWLPGHQLEHGRAPWRDPYSFQPEAATRTNFPGWPFALIFWPLDVLLGTVGAWNAFVFLSYLGAGVATFAWLRALGLPRGPALVGGLVFALAPYRSVQTAAGHLSAPVSILIPLALYGIESRRAWLATAALASIPLSGQVHLALAAIPFVLAYALVRRRTLEGVMSAGVAVVAGAVVYVVAIRGSTGASGRSFGQVERYSAELADLVTRHARDGLESFAFLGWLVPIAAVAGLVVLARSDGALACVLGLGAAIPIVLALGANTPLYRPLWDAVPGLQHTRVPERLLPVACLALAALVAYALARVDVPYATAVALVLVALDLHVDAYTPLRADEHNAVYARLDGLPAGRVVERPVFLPDRQEGSVYLYYAMQAPNERPLGYSTTAPKVADVVARRLRHGNRAELRRLGVRYVVRFADGAPAALGELP
jgi:hypothetical protein